MKGLRHTRQLPFISFNFEKSLSKFSRSPPPAVRLANSWISRSNMGSEIRVGHTWLMYVLGTVSMPLCAWTTAERWHVVPASQVVQRSPGAPFPVSPLWGGGGHCFRLEMWLALKGTSPSAHSTGTHISCPHPLLQCTMATPKPIRTISLSRTCQGKPKQFTSKTELP